MSEQDPHALKVTPEQANALREHPQIRQVVLRSIKDRLFDGAMYAPFKERLLCHASKGTLAMIDRAEAWMNASSRD